LRRGNQKVNKEEEAELRKDGEGRSVEAADRFAWLRRYVLVDRQMKYDCHSLRAERCSTLPDCCCTWVASQIAINTSATRGGSAHRSLEFSAFPCTTCANKYSPELIVPIKCRRRDLNTEK
jgi:deoxycytidylate deaminase